MLALCDNIAILTTPQPINKHLTGTEIQYREQQLPAGPSALFKLHLEIRGGCEAIEDVCIEIDTGL